MIFGFFVILEVLWWAKKINRLFIRPKWYVNFEEYFEMFENVNPRGMLVSFVILSCKNSCDFLQDVSKLDYFEIVSKFQVVLDLNEEYLTRF